MLRSGPTRTAAVLVFWTVCVLASAARAEEGEDPARDAGAFLVDLSERAIAKLGDQSIGESERQERFQALLESNFDLPRISRFVLGNYARRSTKTERAEFQEIFGDLLTARFLPYFRDYRGKAFEVLEVKPDRTSSKMTLVVSKVYLEDGSPLPVAWRIVKRGDTFKVVDILAEGVSLALTFRSEYTAALNTTGGSVTKLTERLRGRLEAGKDRSASK